jgi:uncharacterized protein
MMKYFISGGTGFVGSTLVPFLLDRGNDVIATGTSLKPKIQREKLQYISADTTRPGDWQKAIGDVDVIINLAGRSIFKRWTQKYKNLMRDSRILTTRHIVDAIPKERPVTLLSASAVGFYGNREDEKLSELEPAGDDFLAEVSKDWEAEAINARAKGARVVLMRLGIVLGKGGGAVDKMTPAFRFFAGGPLGNGKQWFPWIHMDDLANAILFLIDHEDITGPVNLCAPNPVRNLELAKTMGRILKRPSWMPAPAIMMRIVLGEFASALLSGQRAIPEKLSEQGFAFQYPDIFSALSDILS